MEIGTKIIATNSGYATSVPNGTIMTVTHVFGGGHVEAAIDGGYGFNWYMTKGTFEEYTPLPYGHVTLPDGRTVDLTANRVRCDLMDPNELQAMKSHGGPWEIRAFGKWNVIGECLWLDHSTYRVAPEPVVRTLTFYATDTLKGFGITRGPNSKHKLTLTIQDNDIIDTKTEKL